jgi:hypothetical protein
VDARGGNVIPAVTDSHGHFSCLVRVGKAVDLSVAQSESDLILLFEPSASHQTGAKTLNVTSLDRIQNWVVIRHWRCHEHLFNSHTIS